MLSFSRVSNLPDDLPDWIRAEASVKRHAAAVREAAVLLEAAGVAVDYTYMCLSSNKSACRHQLI